MPLNEDAVYTPARGYVFVADEDTVRPTATEVEDYDPSSGTPPATGWTQVGHTSRDTLPEFGFDGGDTETRGTWQNDSLKTVVTEAIVDYVTVSLHQFDSTALELYYGVANSSTESGTFTVSDTSQRLRTALLIIVVDGDTTVGFYAGRTDAARDDAMSMEVDQFAAMPVRFTILSDANDEKFSWISEDTGVDVAS